VQGNKLSSGGDHGGNSIIARVKKIWPKKILGVFIWAGSKLKVFYRESECLDSSLGAGRKLIASVILWKGEGPKTSSITHGLEVRLRARKTDKLDNEARHGGISTVARAKDNGPKKSTNDIFMGRQWIKKSIKKAVCSGCWEGGRESWQINKQNKDNMVEFLQCAGQARVYGTKNPGMKCLMWEGMWPKN
jgi:hypothetical protein